MSPARVGLDARLTRQLSVGMQNVRSRAGRTPAAASRLEFAFIPFARGGNFGWAEQVRLPLAIARSRVDLVHFLSQYAPAVVPARFIVTIHDLIHLRFPQYFKSKVGPYYETVVRWTWLRAARVITDDERTVEDLVGFLGTRREKMRVIPLGVAEASRAR